MEIKNLLNLFKELTKKYPYLKYMGGVIGIVIGIKIITLILGNNLGYIPIFLLAIAFMYILYFFSKNSKNDKNGRNANLAYIISIFILIVTMVFIVFVMSAYIFGKPCPLVKLFEIKNGECIDKKEIKKYDNSIYDINITGIIRDNKNPIDSPKVKIYFPDYKQSIKEIYSKDGNYVLNTKIDTKENIELKFTANGYRDVTKYIDIETKYLNIEMVSK